MLSVIAGSRNDGHGRNLIERTQVFIDGLAHQADLFERDVELVLVEWNPPADHPGLADVLSAPSNRRFEVRIITVPPEVHRRVPYSANQPFFQMLAKNVGIRRAEGENVLATNIDILLSNELFLATSGHLEDRTLYRADRVDVPFEPGQSMDPATIRKGQPVRINRKDGIHYPGEGRTYPHIRGWRDLGRLIASNPVSFFWRLFTTSPNSGRPSWRRYRLSVLKVLRLPLLHTNACGDFTLMTAKSWAELGAYPEWPFYSWNLDSLLLYQASAAGFGFVDFADPAFHMEHAAGWSPEAHLALFERLDEQGIPVLTDAALAEVAHTLTSQRGKTRWRINAFGGWGFPAEALSAAGVNASS